MHVEVEFSGGFPGGQTGEVFVLLFDGVLTANITADLTWANPHPHATTENP